jgi:hypothetical protein
MVQATFLLVGTTPKISAHETSIVNKALHLQNKEGNT